MARKGVHTELQLYLREINGIQLLTAQEEKDLGWLIVNDSCPEAKDRMIKLPDPAGIDTGSGFWY